MFKKKYSCSSVNSSKNTIHNTAAPPSPRLMKAQEIQFEAKSKKRKTPTRPPSNSPAFKVVSKLQPSASTNQIGHNSNKKPKLEHSYINYHTNENNNKESPKKLSANKENSKSSKTPTGVHSKISSNSICDNNTGIPIITGIMKKPSNKAIYIENDDINPSDPFQILLNKAQKELQKCGNYDTDSNGELSISESMANTVREARKEEYLQKSTNENKNEIEMLKKEVEKWKEFGYLLAESYDQLKKNFAKESNENSKNKKIVIALKEQVSKLKDLLKHVQNEKEKIEQELSNEETIREQFIMNKNKFVDINSENARLKQESEKLAKKLNALEKENEILYNEKSLNEKMVTQLNEKIKVFF